MSIALAEEDIESAYIEDPVELYWLTGGRQNSAFLIGAEGADIQSRHLVRRSVARAAFEGGEGDCPHLTEKHPRMGELTMMLAKYGCIQKPAMTERKVPQSRWSFISEKMEGLEEPSQDCTDLLYKLREVKSEWEVSMMRESGEINHSMFESIRESGGLGKTELEIAGVAEEVSRASGFGGRIRMRKWPMDCDRVVIAAGRSGGVPSYFDSAVGGVGGSPISPLGAGFSRVKEGDPVLIDIVHVHRGYVSDCTRMFCSGKLDREWEKRLDDMIEIGTLVRRFLGRGEDCSTAWRAGREAAEEMGHGENLMGIRPEQASFLGHSVGLELDETPVVANGFDRPLHLGGTMAIEPKVIHRDGAIGIEDTWTRTSEGMECLTSGDGLPNLIRW
jgi:Xaa-Pro aminopeptidase